MFYEPVNEILADEQVVKAQQEQKDKQKLRFYKFPSDRNSELVARILIYNSKLSWRAISYKHFKVGSKVHPCIDGYKNIDKLNAAQNIYFKPYIYDQETKQQIPVLYNESVKKDFFDNYFNIYEQNRYNPKKVLELIDENENDITLSAIRKTAEYLTATCPICAAIKKYSLSLDPNFISQFKTVATYYLLIVDIASINLFNRYVAELGYDYKSISLEDVVYLSQSFAERYPERTILPQILNITASQYAKLIDDLKKYKDVLSATKGTNVIFKKTLVAGQRVRMQNSHSFDLASVNTPIHVNPNVMDYISQNMYDLDKIFLPPSLDIINEMHGSDEIKSFEMMLASAVAKKQRDYAEQVKKIVYNAPNSVDALPVPNSMQKTSISSANSPSNVKQNFEDNSLDRPDRANEVAASSQKMFKYKVEALRKNKNNPLPVCYGDKNVYNKASMKCYNCPVNFYCFQEIEEDNLPF